MTYEKFKMLDVLIIGAGPIGLACGIEATKHKLNYLILEKGVLVNSLYHYPDNMTFFSTSEKLEIGGVPFVSNNPKPRKHEALEYYRRVAEKFQLNINFYESVKGIAKGGDHFVVNTSKGIYKTKSLVIATGFYDLPNKLNIPGEELSKVKHYYTDPHPYYRQKVVVIGAQNSAVDAALECWRKGAEVTMIVRGPEIANRVKYWVRPDIENRIEEGSIKAHFNANVTKVEEHSLTFMKDNKEHTIPNDFVLALTGYQPGYDLLKMAGVNISNEKTMRPSYNEANMESNIRQLYLAGVVVGGMETAKWFIENSRIHADLIMNDIMQKIKGESQSNSK